MRAKNEIHVLTNSPANSTQTAGSLSDWYAVQMWKSKATKVYKHNPLNSISSTYLNSCHTKIICWWFDMQISLLHIHKLQNLLSQCSMIQCWWSLYQKYQGNHRIWFIGVTLILVHQQKICIFIYFYSFFIYKGTTFIP